MKSMKRYGCFLRRDRQNIPSADRRGGLSAFPQGKDKMSFMQGADKVLRVERPG